MSTKMLFNLAKKGTTRSNGCQLKPEKFKLEVRQEFLTVTETNQWNKLPREEVESLFPDGLTSQLVVFLEGGFQ